ncbi:MAG: hypothetical protein AB7R69_00635 [Candidatus Babeliales bacterium]
MKKNIFIVFILTHFLQGMERLFIPYLANLAQSAQQRPENDLLKQSFNNLMCDHHETIAQEFKLTSVFQAAYSGNTKEVKEWISLIPVLENAKNDLGKTAYDIINQKKQQVQDWKKHANFAKQKKRTSIFQAAQNGSLPEVQQWVKEHSALIWARDAEGKTVLDRACFSQQPASMYVFNSGSHAKLIEFIQEERIKNYQLDPSVDVIAIHERIAEEIACPSLFQAVTYGQLSLLKAWIERHPSLVWSKSIYGNETALDRACYIQQYGYYSPINEDIVTLLQEKRIENYNSKKNIDPIAQHEEIARVISCPSLFQAVWDGNLPLVKAWIKKHPQLRYATCKSKDTALTIAFCLDENAKMEKKDEDKWAPILNYLNQEKNEFLKQDEKSSLIE